MLPDVLLGRYAQQHRPGGVRSRRAARGGGRAERGGPQSGRGWVGSRGRAGARGVGAAVRAESMPLGSGRTDDVILYGYMHGGMLGKGVYACRWSGDTIRRYRRGDGDRVMGSVALYCMAGQGMVGAFVRFCIQRVDRGAGAEKHDFGLLLWVSEVWVYGGV